MIIELYIFLELIMIAFFATAFFTKQEILWSITLVLSGVLMYTSFFVEYIVYEYNASIGAYQAVSILYSYPYMMGVNMIFSILALTLGLFDMFDKYGNKFAGGKGDEFHR